MHVLRLQEIGALLVPRGEVVAAMKRRHNIPIAVFQRLGLYAPAFGMIGTLIGTDNYFRYEARESALTDFGVGNGGNVYRWTKPGASISPWASGATGVAHAVPSGDGVDFVNRYGWRQNSDTESIEIEGLKYSDPVPAADYQALVQLVAWRVDSWLKIPWNQWPKNHDGAQAIYWHNEFQDEKPCPGQVVMDFTDRLIEDVRVRLRQYQEG